MKKTLLAISIAAASLPLWAQSLSMGATAVPHAELLELVRPQLAEQGIDLQVRVFTDYVQPNIQVQEGRLDANFFQHLPYLENFNQNRGTNLVSLFGVHVEPFGIYSSSHTELSQLNNRATVAIPNDATNGGRALLLLQKAGLISLKSEAGITATPRDIIDNPLNLRIREIEAATLPRILGQVDLALINTNYALEAGLNPMQDALLLEGADSPYVNIVVSRAGYEQDERLLALQEALMSDQVKEFINQRYQGAVVPAF